MVLDRNHNPGKTDNDLEKKHSKRNQNDVNPRNEKHIKRSIKI
jgi:hypothetical protein